MTLPTPTLDHVVVNARDRMDEAAALYRRLGFQLTPRGHHTLGSINHLAIFGTDYLELIGVPAADAPRGEVMEWPHGLNGLVFGTEDSAAVHAALEAAGVESSAPREFSRPVELPDGTKQDAVFRTVGLPRRLASAGRLYFCHHFTRRLVWRDEWRVHPNGTLGVAGAVIASTPAEVPVHAALFRRMFGHDMVSEIRGGFRLKVGLADVDVVDATELKERYGRGRSLGRGSPGLHGGAAAARAVAGPDRRRVAGRTGRVHPDGPLRRGRSDGRARRHPRVLRMRLALAAAGLLAGCSSLAPESFVSGTPEMRPETFFAGTTRSSGVLEDRGGAPTRRLHVAGTGRPLANGDLELVQDVTFDQDAPTRRTWVLHRLDAHRYTASLTDAADTVQGEAYGDLFHLRYTLRSPPGGTMEQWMYLQPDGSTVVNEATIRLLGVVVARLSERITHGG